ncbi:MAG: hypothetical protein AVDCRST_MAG25-1043, partial [uncultured Rubrobacteraceae bacterium]
GRDRREGRKRSHPDVPELPGRRSPRTPVPLQPPARQPVRQLRLHADVLGPHLRRVRQGRDRPRDLAADEACRAGDPAPARRLRLARQGPAQAPRAAERGRQGDGLRTKEPPPPPGAQL